VGRLGSGVWVSASFQKNPRPVSQLGLLLGLRSGNHVVCRLGSGPRVVRRLRSRVWVSVSLQIFALTAGECPKWEWKLSGLGNIRGNIPEEGNVLHSSVVCFNGRIRRAQYPPKWEWKLSGLGNVRGNIPEEGNVIHSSVVCFNGRIRRAQYSIVAYFGFKCTTAYN